MRLARRLAKRKVDRALTKQAYCLNGRLAQLPQRMSGGTTDLVRCWGGASALHCRTSCAPLTLIWLQLRSGEVQCSPILFEMPKQKNNVS